VFGTRRAIRTRIASPGPARRGIVPVFLRGRSVGRPRAVVDDPPSSAEGPRRDTRTDRGFHPGVEHRRPDQPPIRPCRRSGARLARSCVRAVRPDALIETAQSIGPALFVDALVGRVAAGPRADGALPRRDGDSTRSSGGRPYACGALQAADTRERTRPYKARSRSRSLFLTRRKLPLSLPGARAVTTGGLADGGCSGSCRGH
jgi:hypothetical protein